MSNITSIYKIWVMVRKSDVLNVQFLIFDPRYIFYTTSSHSQTCMNLIKLKLHGLNHNTTRQDTLIMIYLSKTQFATLRRNNSG